MPAEPQPGDEAAGLQPIFLFDSDDPGFARGFEAGRIWQRLTEVEEVCVEVAHFSNVEMFLRMAEALGRRMWAVDLDSTWAEVTFDARPSDA